MNFQEIPYVKLSSVQKKKALEILGRGNVLLKKWAVFFPSKKYRQFRNAVMDGNRNPEYDGKTVIPSDKLEEFHADLPFITAIRFNKYDELDGRSAEQAILESFSALAKQHAKKWLKLDSFGVTPQDLLQEAYMQVIEAMYSWMPNRNVEISTFVWVSLRNRMSNVANQQGNMLCPLTNSDLELMIKFEKTKRQMPEFFTFDQIIDELGLSQEESNKLNVLLTRVFTENQLGHEDENNGFDSNDYTGHRVGAHQESETDLVLGKQQVSDTLDRAGLTSIERELIEMAMEPFNGWQTEFARTHINPTTGKSYTRMRITQILVMAREKVAKALERQKIAA